ncbi:leucine-rich_repeat domain-containing protein [Hexamita inflata]|uniref:Leucine-rich repeat domain-containing protein n=1 Tax=Hexamita inflata TaxID=28002 RepID=A0AA86R9V0_9EUKA|nr:leucine-rich repeat domain-containing protein [Hexamita inflata]
MRKNMDPNQQYDAKMTQRYKGKIKDGKLEITDSEITNLSFLEKLEISMLKINVSSGMHVILKSKKIKELKMLNVMDEHSIFNLNDLELENLEVMELQDNDLENDKLNNLSKFMKLNTLDVSRNKVDLTNIHNVTSLTKLYLRKYGLQSIDQIASLVNLKDLDISGNIDIELSPLYKLKSLSKLQMCYCNLKNIDQIVKLITLEVLAMSSNYLQNIDSIRLLVNLKELDISLNENLDITPLKDLVGLIQLDLNFCGLKHLSALKPLINLHFLDLSFNSGINITELQYLTNLTHLNLEYCDLVSICALTPLENLENLNVQDNQIVFLDINHLTKLKLFNIERNRINTNSLKQHPNYNLSVNNKRCFKITNQKKPSNEELFRAKTLKNVESSIILLKNAQNKYQIFQTALKLFQNQIYAVVSKVDFIQFTSLTARFFEMLNESVSQ